MNERLDNLLRHIENVRAGCELLGRRLMAKGEIDIGLQLTANGQIHDYSKFKGVEWGYLNESGPRPDPDPRESIFRAAHLQHVTTNPHHPEYWGSVDKMPRIYRRDVGGLEGSFK